MIREEIQKNKTKSFVMVFFFIIFVVVVAYVIGRAMHWGALAVPLAITIAMVSSIGSYFYSDKIVLTMSKARPATHEEDQMLDNIVEGLAIAAGIPKPKIYVIDDSAPNAFATGRNPQHAVVCVTTGLMEKLNRTELEGVVAHELSHIKNYDILLSTLTVVMVGVIALLSDWMMRSLWWGGGRRSDRDEDRGGGNAAAIFMVLGIVLAILAPVIATLIQLAISRKRESLADASGALLTRYPKGLADALRKISADTEPLEAANKATAHLYICNPLHDIGGKLNSLFDTHPPIEERIAALEKM
jgi:heat shock protein HtpX